ncbi:MAG: penicillin-binding protein activator, partial [Luminiphilus sp.]|nr:penicillin-binding protein activator [Luminiphilus sp.]
GKPEVAHTLLRNTRPPTLDGQLFVLALRQERAELERRWLDAGKLAHRRLTLTRDALPKTAPDDYPSEAHAVGNEIWADLMQLDDTQLERAVASSEGADWRGWLTLAQAYRSGRTTTYNWLASHPGHTATEPLPAGLGEWLDTEAPMNIAVLLPLSGRLASAGTAVLEGMMEGIYRRFRDYSTRPRIFTVDTELWPSAVAAYRSALAQGADLVLGPLIKSEAETLGNLRDRPTPIIALNRPETLASTEASHWLAMSLAPEDEARQIARLAFGRGLRRALVIRPDTEWGRRMEVTLNDQWRNLGGVTASAVTLTAEPSVSEQIGAGTGATDSELRIQALEQAFEAPIEARARRSKDFDVVFLLARDPEEARRLRPLLIYHYSGDVPVYSSSAAYSGQDQGQNQDLNDLILVETPAVLDAIEVDRFTRLNALGFDAVRMIDHWQQAEATDAPVFRGRTGILRRRANGEIERELNSVAFDGGKLKALALP